MILITTARKVDSEAVRLLAQREMPVRVLVRNPETAKALEEAGAEIAVGDLEGPASIDQAMAAVTTMVLVSPGVPAQELNAVHSGPGRCRSRHRGHQQRLGGLSYRPAALAERSRPG